MNMDGIEWKRKKWGVFARIWFYFNEWAGSLLADHLIADHPKIQERYSGRRKSSDVTMIPYGADDVTQADELLIKQYGLQANEYAVYIARPEPENSLFEVVTAFSKTSRGYPLIILSRMMPETNKFHKKVMSEASDEVQFLGAIHEREIVNALRYFSKYYIHGHTVGGTNPSLVEALGAGSPVLAHANEFNRWVAGEGAHYFNTAEELETMFDSFVTNQHQLESLRTMSKCRFLDSFTWDRILSEYERLLTKYLQS